MRIILETYPLSLMKWDMLDPQRKVCKLSDVDVFVSILRILIFHIHAAPEQKPNTGFQKYSRFQEIPKLDIIIILMWWITGWKSDKEVDAFLEHWKARRQKRKYFCLDSPLSSKKCVMVSGSLCLHPVYYRELPINHHS